MSKAADDVLTFLESLDSLQSPTGTENKTTSNGLNIENKDSVKFENSNTTESVLKFLDDITATTTPTTTEIKTTKKIAEPIVTETSSKPVTSAKTKSADSSSTSNRWNWGSIWTTAQSTVNQASQTFKVTMENAQKNIESNEKLKGITSQFNKENIEKLGNDLKKMTANVIDSIAPPIPLTKPENETTIWLQVNDEKNFSEQVYDVVRYVEEEIFANAKKNIINGKLQISKENINKRKDKPSAVVGISNAVGFSADTLKELMALHPEREKKVQQIPNEKSSLEQNVEKPMKEITTTYRDIFMVIQPFNENLTPPNSKKILTHVSYYITMFYPDYQDSNNDIYMSYVSQSVSCKDNMESENDEVNPLRSQIYEEWCDDQKLKAIESAVWSLFEELLVRKKEYTYNAEAIAGLSGQII